ncbi:MAG: sigma-70 family RNA polymerase sigma factor [Planctomycetota bacterium]|nr:sigma-70 family RNA polymerase sigma factor [Planctomycetota bacterium]
MNTPLVQLIHRAIRGERSALRGVVERYQGVSYALAYHATRSYPQAQRLARRAWVHLARRLGTLQEPEGLPDLIAQCVEKARETLPPPKPDDVEADGEGHSVLKTEKVQARRSLRLALADCPLEEATVFFLRHVEGLSLAEIAVLLGAEEAEMLASLRRVTVDVAFRAGFAGPEALQQDLDALPPLRREARGVSVVLAEGGLPYAKRAELEKFIQLDPDARREDEAVRQVLALSAGTFAAHRLPQDFVKDVLQDIPYAEPARRISETAPALRLPAPPKLLQMDVRHGSQLALALVSMLVGAILSFWVLEQLATSTLGAFLAALAGTPTSLGPTILVLGVSGLALFFARPPLFSALPRLPVAYFISYGVAAGVLLAFTCSLVFDWYGSTVLSFVLVEILFPLYAIVALGLLGVRALLAFRDMERRLEVRLRQIEDALGPLDRPAAEGASETPASAETSPEALRAATPAPAPEAR